MGPERDVNKKEFGIENSSTNLVDSPRTWKDRFQARYILTLIMFIGSAIIYALRVNLNITIVAMIKHSNSSNSAQNHSVSEDTCTDNLNNQLEVVDNFLNSTITIPLSRQGSFDWSQGQQGTILGGFYYGYLATQMLGGRLAHRFGPRVVYGGGILMSSILTLLTPIAAEWHLVALVALRILIGFFQGISFPAIYSIVPYWYTTKELSTNLAIILTGNHIGTIIAMPIAGYLCDNGFGGGWPSVFYLFGIAGCLYCVVFFIFVVDKPEEHSWISQKELQFLQNGRGSKFTVKNPPVPWKKILTSGPVYALAVAKMAAAYSYHVVLTKIPTYLDGVLKFSVEKNGLINAAIYICKSASGILGGFLADEVLKRNILTSDPTRKIFEAIALIGMAIFMVPISLVECDITLVIIFLCLALFVSGFNSGGDFPAPMDMAPTFSGTIFGIINTFAAASGVLAPLAVGLILQEDGESITRWSYVFYSSAGICVVGIVVFVFFGSCKLQPWATSSSEPIQEDHGKSTN